MLTIADTIYPTRFAGFEAVITALSNDMQAEAMRLLEIMAAPVEDITSPAERLQTQLFLNAFRTRLDPQSDGGNLYLVADEGQQIKMFNLMAAKFPVVRLAQTVTNRIYANRLGGQKRFSILDIGIGTGQQIAGLIEMLQAQHSLPDQIAVLGIEPSAESLAKAEARFRELAQTLEIDIAFTGIAKTVEQLDSADWETLRAGIADNGGKLFINASFAMHHVRPLAFRTEFFRQLKTLQPEVFVMIEPYADFTTDSLPQRFRNAWHHYGLTFQGIDTIDASDEEKSAVKHVFFGREMIDVLAPKDRVEQFETAEMWLERLTASGFVPESISQPDFGDFNPLIRIQSNGNYLGFNVHGHPIVAVICAG